MGPASPATAADYAQSSADNNSREIKALKDRVRQLEIDLRRLLVLDIPVLPPETKVSPMNGWLFLNKDNHDITDRGD